MIIEVHIIWLLIIEVNQMIWTSLCLWRWLSINPMPPQQDGLEVPPMDVELSQHRFWSVDSTLIFLRRSNSCPLVIKAMVNAGFWPIIMRNEGLTNYNHQDSIVNSKCMEHKLLLRFCGWISDGEQRTKMSLGTCLLLGTCQTGTGSPNRGAHWDGACWGTSYLCPQDTPGWDVHTRFWLRLP